MKGSGAFSDEEGKVFYGIGSASGIRNFSLQRIVADDRARNDLAKVIEFYTRSLLKDYMGSTTARDFMNSEEEQLSETVMKTFTNSMHHGVVVIDHWEHPQRNELFSLAKLDLDRVKKGLNTYLKLSEKVQSDVERRAKDLHQEMEDKLREYRKNNNWVSQLWMEARPTF